MKSQHRTENPGIASVVAASVVAALVLIFGLAAPEVRAAQFTEAQLFVELNDTDGDLGLHASIDGGPWKVLEIEDPNGHTLLEVTARGNFARQGGTQLFLESAEPPFDELAPEEFFSRFPQGRYQIEGTDLNGREFKATVRLSHVLAAPPANIRVNTELDKVKNCDEASLPSVTGPVTISWDQVTESHPGIGASGNVDIARYQFFVEQGDFKLAVDLPPAVTTFAIPSAVITPGSVKIEIIATTSTGNNTAVEQCFMLVP
jgi:hypothetical protein